MIELTREQVQALTESNGTEPRILNPQTKETFVLVPLAEYERLKAEAEYDASPWTEEEIDLLRLEACEALDSFGQNT